MSFNIPNPMNKGAPPPPDYAGAARQDTLINRPNQSTPWASSRWTMGPSAGAPDESGFIAQMDRQGVPASMRGQLLEQFRSKQSQQYSQDVSLAPGLQSANDSMISQLGSAWSAPLDNGAGARQHAEDAIYQRAASRLDPRFAQEQHDLTTTLANQGIDPNSAAYRKSLDNFGRTKNDAYSSALMDAIMGGGQEASRQQQMDLTSRMAPLSAMGGLRSLIQMPGFQPGGGQLAAANAAGNYGLESQQMNQQFWNDLISNGMKIKSAAG